MLRVHTETIATMTPSRRTLASGGLFLLCLGIQLDLSLQTCDTGRLFVGSVNSNFPELLPANGIYLPHETDNNGFPVFKHQMLDFYLYHIEGNLLDLVQHPGFWAVGHHVGGADALLSAPSSRSNPSEVGLDWRAWNSQSQRWQQDRRLKAKCVPETFDVCQGGNVLISGLEPDHMNQAERLGVYVLTNETYELRPVYKHQQTEQYLFFRHGLWLIGPEVGTVTGGLFVPDSAWRAEFIIHDWVVFNGHHFDDDPTVRVTCLEASDSTVSPYVPDPADRPAEVVEAQDTPKCPEPCLNGGTCVSTDSNDTRCQCLPGSFGERCQEVVSCDPLPTSGSTMVAVHVAGRRFLDVAYVACLEQDGEPGELTAVVCQSDGRWSPLPPCHPGIHHATPETDNEAAPGPMALFLRGARSRRHIRSRERKTQIEENDQN